MTKKQPTKKAVIVTRIFIAVLVLAVAMTVFFFVSSIVDKRTLLDNDQRVTGTVVSHDLHTSTSRSMSFTSRKISYSFTPKGSSEKVIQNDFYVSRKEYEKYPIGAQISVTYLPTKASMNQPSVSIGHMSPIVLNFLYLFLVIVVLIVCNKTAKNLLAKLNIKSPGWPYYILVLGGFMLAFSAAALLTVLISNLISAILS